MSTRIAVIGSNSFSGATFVAHALSQDMEVIGISRSGEPSRVLLPYKWVDHRKFSFEQLDLNSNLDEIMVSLDRFKPGLVVNFAAQSMVGQSWEFPEHWFTTNVLSMVKLHDRLRHCDYLEKYVQISTPEVYGSTSGLVKEDAPYNPSTPYAVSKAACDMSLMTFLKAYKFPVVFTRAANVCGPGQQLYRIIPRTIFCILSGEKLQLQGGGLSVRSFIHMKDVSDGTMLAGMKARPGSIYHFSTEERVSIKELVEKICESMEVDFDQVIAVVESRTAQDQAYLLDCGRATEELGWKPRHSLDNIISETVNWMKSMWDEIKHQPTSYVHKP